MNIGFISTRFAGLDGVSLESDKWAYLLEEMGHDCFWFAGECDKDSSVSMVVPEAFFGHQDVKALTPKIFGVSVRNRETTNEIRRQTEYLKDKLYSFIDKFSIDLIIPQNILAIPMHVPLGVAMSEVIAETGIPTIAHHHDFYWERPRFLLNSIQDIIEQSFPPKLSSVKHVVINSIAQNDLATRKGISSTIIYNIIDFKDVVSHIDDYNKDFRKDFGFSDEDLLILQPTRVVSRKGIEQAIHLVKRLQMPNAKLIISHSPGDEGMEYFDWLKETAQQQDVPLYCLHNRLNESRKFSSSGDKLYSLWDVYPHVDLITYPSLYEGFGNAFLEAIYFKKPILVNRYSVYITDIENKGFDVIEMDGFLTNDTVKEVRNVLTDKDRRSDMVNRNFALGKKSFSYEVLRKQLQSLLSI